MSRKGEIENVHGEVQTTETTRIHKYIYTDVSILNDFNTRSEWSQTRKS